MTEISLNILDIAENSVKAGATLVSIIIKASTKNNILTVIISDNGCGMNEQQLKNVTDPFFTTRTTRKVGLGVPFFKAAAEAAGGSFEITSSKNKGTSVTATFEINNIDRMPLGDIAGTMHTLITMYNKTDFYFCIEVDDKKTELSTSRIKEILGDIPLQTPDVSNYIRDYLKENIAFVMEEKII